MIPQWQLNGWHRNPPLFVASCESLQSGRGGSLRMAAATKQACLDWASGCLSMYNSHIATVNRATYDLSQIGDHDKGTPRTGSVA